MHRIAERFLCLKQAAADQKWYRKNSGKPDNAGRSHVAKTIWRGVREWNRWLSTVANCREGATGVLMG